MKILTICDQWNNRSVTLASQLKYWGNDVISAGLSTNSQETLHMLFEWADKIIITEDTQKIEYECEKIILCPIWPDIYPRAFNPELLSIVKEWLQENKTILKNK